MPTPRVNRPPSSTLEVAAAWAVTTGCIRTVGQVTSVVTGSSTVRDRAPIIDHTKGLLPWAFVHGWKWSEMARRVKPASAARRAWRSSWSGVNSSQDRK